MLQKLPLKKDFYNKKIIKKLISANRALAELNGVSQKIPNQNILINSLSLQKAKDSSEIENIVTTHDELYKAEADKKHLGFDVKNKKIFKTKFTKNLFKRFTGNNFFKSIY